MSEPLNEIEEAQRRHERIVPLAARWSSVLHRQSTAEERMKETAALLGGSARNLRALLAVALNHKVRNHLMKKEPRLLQQVDEAIIESLK